MRNVVIPVFIFLLSLSSQLHGANDLPRKFSNPLQLAQAFEIGKYESQAKYDERIGRLVNQKHWFNIDLFDDDNNGKEVFQDKDIGGTGGSAVFSASFNKESGNIEIAFNYLTDGNVSLPTLAFQRMTGRNQATNGFGRKITVTNWIQQVVYFEAIYESTEENNSPLGCEISVTSPAMARRLLNALELSIYAKLIPSDVYAEENEFPASMRVPNHVIRVVRHLNVKLLKIVIKRKDTNTILATRTFE